MTGRAAVLALVVCALALSLAYPLREYLAQRSQIADMRRTVAAQEARVADLQSAADRWNDPAFVKAQAAGRLHYEMPGETQYVVLEPDEAPAPGDQARHPTGAAPERPWFSDVWASVDAAAGE